MNKLYQVSTLNALLLGNLYGVVSIKELLKNGNYGIGTCEGVDGEMIVLDGTAYNSQAAGGVRKYKDDEKVAFATVCSFSEDTKKYILNDVNSLKELSEKLTRIIKQEYKNQNIFYIVKIETVLEDIKLRSYNKESKPYRTLMEISSSQIKNEYENISGDIIGVYCPAYVERLNMPGWHYHFISSDRTKGGHLVNLSFKQAHVDIDSKNQYEVILPTNDKFATINLSANLKEETNQIES